MELINIETQEKMETLVLNKLSFLNKSTFDADEQYLNKDGKMNFQWNLHHFIRVGKIISNELWSIKNQVTKMESTHKNIIVYSASAKLRVAILLSSLSSSLLILAEYTMIFEDEFARDALDKVSVATDKIHMKMYKLYKDGLDKKEMSKADAYNALCRIRVMVLKIDAMSNWYSNELDKRINGYQTPTVYKPSKLVAKLSNK